MLRAADLAFAKAKPKTRPSVKIPRPGSNMITNTAATNVLQDIQEQTMETPSSSSTAPFAATQEVLSNLAGLPIVPYRLRPRVQHDQPDQRRVAKKQRVAFCGSVLDSADAKWYEDEAEMDLDHPSPALERYPPLNEQTSSSSCGPSFPEANASRVARTLTRYDSEQAVDRYLHTIDDNK